MFFVNIQSFALRIRNLSRVPYIDSIGIIGSSICAIHCFALPILTIFLPLASFHTWENFDYLLAPFSLLLGFYSVLHGYFHHHLSSFVIFLFLLSSVLISFSFFPFFLHSHSIYIDLFASLGAILMAYTHYCNWKLSRLKNIKCQCNQ